MNLKKIALSVVLVDFVALNIWAFSHHGVVGAVEALVASPAAITASVDAVIALTLLAVVIWRDARQQGRNPLPWIGLTALTGSVGPLAYGISRLGDAAKEGDAVAAR
jgi:hypothetical protein